MDLKLDELYVAEPPRQRGPDYKLALQRPSVLGWNALKELRVEVDYREGRWSSASPEAGQASPAPTATPAAPPAGSFVALSTG